ncbi:MAG: nucleotidyltransferase domain-containing protein, partial [Nanoarchaeota archaeon]|nr:nucleotidyltransferase domain-containing protein [Nanoarchaeota archaeon]
NQINMSQKGIALVLQELEEADILRSEKRGNMLLYSLHLSNPIIKDILTITETMKKLQFLKKNLKIQHIFQDNYQLIGIFGSYAKGKHKKDSDIDVFAIGKEPMIKKYDMDVHVQVFKEKEFVHMLQEKIPLAQEIVSNHIILSHPEQFTWMIWEEYYGLHKMVFGSEKRHFIS